MLLLLKLRNGIHFEYDGSTRIVFNSCGNKCTVREDLVAEADVKDSEYTVQRR
jgi:hypothetical protein